MSRSFPSDVPAGTKMTAVRRRVERERGAGVARRVLDEVAATLPAQVRDHHRRTPVLVRAGGIEIIEEQPHANAPEGVLDEWCSALSPGDEIVRLLQRQRRKPATDPFP